MYFVDLLYEVCPVVILVNEYCDNYNNSLLLLNVTHCTATLSQKR